MGSRSGSDAGCGVKIFEFSFFKLLLNISNPDSIRNAAGSQAFCILLDGRPFMGISKMAEG